MAPRIGTPTLHRFRLVLVPWAAIVAIGTTPTRAFSVHSADTSVLTLRAGPEVRTPAVASEGLADLIARNAPLNKASVSPGCSEVQYRVEITGDAQGYVDFRKEFCGGEPAHLYGNGASLSGGDVDSGIWAMFVPIGSAPLTFLPPQVGQTWSATGYWNDYTTIATSVVVSTSDTLTVWSGIFTNCARVKTTYSYPSGQAFITPTQFDEWFAPGVGPVKYTMAETQGAQTFGELTAYQLVGADPNDYFPLGRGSTWVFVGKNGRAVGASISSGPTPTPTVPPLPSPTALPLPCVGDCKGDGHVTVDELLKGVNIALGNTALAECPSFDCNANGQVTVDCLLKAVNAALSGCSGPAGRNIAGLWCFTNNVDTGPRSDNASITQSGDQIRLVPTPPLEPCTGYVTPDNGIYYTCPGDEVCKMEFEGIVSPDTTSMSGMGYDEDCSGQRQGHGWQWTAVRGPCPA